MTVYQEFDAMAAAYNERPGDISRCVGSLTELASYLPQAKAGHIPEKRAAKWARKTLITELGIEMSRRSGSASGADLEADATAKQLDQAWRQAVWHLKRACGIGGSDIAQVVLHLRDGKSGDYGDARTIAMQKLLIFSPLEGNEAMSRGKRMEDLVRGMHHAEEGSRTCEGGMLKVKGRRSANFPHLVGNPDDLTLLTSGGKNYRFLDDYKCPSVKVFSEYEKSGVPDSYVFQLHQYDILCEDAQVKTSGMRMVAFNYESATTRSFIVPKDPKIRQDIEHFSSVFWNDFVMRGIAPEEIKPKQIEIKDPKVAENMVTMSFLKGLAGAAASRIDEIKEESFGVFSEEDPLTVGTASLGFSSLSRRRVWDVDELVRLNEAADDPADLSGLVKTSERLNSGKVKKFFSDFKKATAEDLEKLQKTKLTDLCEVDADPEKVVKALEEKGISVISAMKTSDSFDMTRKRKGEEAEAKARLDGMSAARIEAIISEIMANPDDILAEIRGEKQPDVDPDDMSAMPEI